MTKAQRILIALGLILIFASGAIAQTVFQATIGTALLIGGCVVIGIGVAPYLYDKKVEMIYLPGKVGHASDIPEHTTFKVMGVAKDRESDTVFATVVDLRSGTSYTFWLPYPPPDVFRKYRDELIPVQEAAG